LAESPGIGLGTTLHYYWNLSGVPGIGEPEGNFPNGSYGDSGARYLLHSLQNDSGDMEKKITKKFYYLSALNLIPVLLLGQGHVLDTLVLAGVLVGLILNHSLLVRMVSQLAVTLSASGDDARRAQRKTLKFMLAKMLLIGALLLLVYFYNQNLIPKVLILVIFQLIIQVVSIKNNY
jgi:hypothetical protein